MKYLLSVFFVVISLSVFAQADYTLVKDVPYYSDPSDAYQKERCRLDIHYPKGKKGVAAIVWFHGGGLTGGNKELPKDLLEKGYIVIGVGYRLSPKAKVSDCIEDAAAAVAWTFAHIGEYGGDSRKIYLSGHSAGGYLVMMVTLNKQYLSRYSINADEIAGIIPFSGQTITHFTARKERGVPEKQPEVDSLAPLFYVRPDAPPMLLITGDKDLELLGRYEENAYLSRMMKVNGHTRTHLLELQGFDHVGMAYPAFPLLLKEVAKWENEKKVR